MAAAFYFVPTKLLAAYIAACTVHELGHLAVLKIHRVRIFSFSVELRGLVIEHGAIGSAIGELMCLLAGPTAGIMFAFLCSELSLKVHIQWLDICAALSLILSVFNLLPCVPLDGGKALRCLAEMCFSTATAEITTYITGLIVSLLLALSGLFFMRWGYGYGIAITGLCLLLSILCEEGIVKMPGMR